MDYSNLGRTGLLVSELCLGTMQFGWSADEEAAFEVMDAFYDAGGNFIDTADVYSRWAEGNDGGVSEEIIGRWMQERGNRHEIVLATKVRAEVWPGPHGEGLSRKHIMKAVEDSLRRLQTDYIDLYQAHAFDANTPIEETMRAFEDLVRQGKVLHIGASNFPAWRLGQALHVSEQRDWARFESLQPHYNLVHRGEFERELKPLCEDEGLGVIPYSPLAGGFLTGKYKRDEPLPDSDRAGGIKDRYFNNETAWNALEEARKIAQERNKSVIQVALAWQLSQDVVTAPIVGANSVKQLEGSLSAVGLRLSKEEMLRLDEASGGPYHWND